MRNAEQQERKNMAERILRDQEIVLNKSEKQPETMEKTKSCTRKLRFKYKAG